MLHIANFNFYVFANGNIKCKQNKLAFARNQKHTNSSTHGKKTRAVAIKSEKQEVVRLNLK